MTNPFTAHPASVNETYWQHLRFALRFGARMTQGGVAALVHALLPFCFIDHCQPHQRRADRDARRGARAQRPRRRFRDDAAARLLDLTCISCASPKSTCAASACLIRADLNVPQDDAGTISDDTRIRASVPGIRDALARGAAVMVTSHLGRPTEGTLTPRTRWRRSPRGSRELLDRPVPLVRDWVDGGAWHAALAPGDLVLLENCRVNVGEKKDDPALAQKIAALCDVYVNDAFGTAHRAEATTHGVARYAPVACAGPLMAAELDALTVGARTTDAAAGRDRRRLEGLDQADDPDRARAQVDTLIVGGGIANTFILAAGGRIGKLAGGAGARGRSPRDPRGISGQGADAGRRGVREVVRGRRDGHDSRRSPTSPTTT